MAIYLDVSAAAHTKAGLSRYTANLARALVQQMPGEVAFFYNRGPKAQLPADLNGVPSCSVRAGYKPWRLVVWLGQLARLGFDRLVPGCELFHATEHLLLPLKGAPTVLTVHDLIFHLFPRHHKRLNYWYLNWALPLFCRRADAIVCVSDNTRRDLVRCWGIDPAKIDVVYEAADPRFRPSAAEQIEAVRAHYGLPERFMLYVGTIEPRKNLSRLLDALAILRGEGEDAHLVVVGSKGWLYHDFFAKLEGFAHRGAVRLTGYVAHEDLPAVYSAAELCVLPSLYEGFGLQILEAMACGTPMVSSRVSSLPEIGGEAARYFDPEDVSAMAAALGQVWRRPELRQAMRQAGRAWAARFSWARAARETRDIYRRLLSERGHP